ncbi:unnamed protein product [Blepharisma stoltei]|uniref:Uncharacterized protein n=1 Tax=Blepharisma stoltei TaxID=1481888 RepID=A0AAU9JLC0_9CILI|nr:unnamed protein product [Blepharisma stoltei]
MKNSHSQSHSLNVSRQASKPRNQSLSKSMHVSNKSSKLLPPINHHLVPIHGDGTPILSKNSSFSQKSGFSQWEIYLAQKPLRDKQRDIISKLHRRIKDHRIYSDFLIQKNEVENNDRILRSLYNKATNIFFN